MTQIKGFTLIEIIIVISIIGIILMIGTSGFSRSVAQRQLMSDAEMIIDNLEATRQIAIARRVDGCNAIIGTRLRVEAGSVERRLECISSGLSLAVTPTITLTVESNSKIMLKNSSIIDGLSGSPLFYTFIFKSSDPKYLQRTLKLKHKNQNICVRIVVTAGYASPTLSAIETCT